jgi:hypothetical protein
MRVSIGVPKIDQGIELVAKQLERPLHTLSENLSREYGGEIEHLLIDVELSPAHADERPEPWPLRFQKKVNPPKTLPSGLDMPPLRNVAHYSFRPNLINVPAERLIGDVLAQLYASTEVLTRKAAKFPGFRAQDFREAVAREIGKFAP